MGLFTRRGRAQTGNLAQGTSGHVSSGQPVWLPGRIEVQVAGESFHQEAIHAVEEGSPPGSPLVAVLVPDPGNAYDSNAVAGPRLNRLSQSQNGARDKLSDGGKPRERAPTRRSARQPGRQYDCLCRARTGRSVAPPVWARRVLPPLLASNLQ